MTFLFPLFNEQSSSLAVVFVTRAIMLLSGATLLLLLPILTDVTASSPRETTDIRFLYQCLDQHNECRRQTGLPVVLEYDREMEQLTRRRAELMATAGKLLPLTGTVELEENSAFVPSANDTVGCRQVVDLWFRNQADTDKKGLPDGIRLMTSRSPILWKEYNKIGCARFHTEKPEFGSFIVCDYSFQ